MRTDKVASAASAARTVFLTAAVRLLQRVYRPLQRAGSFVMTLPVWVVLAVVVLAQWLAVAAVAARAPHNGFYYYSGGDSSWYYTSAWVLGHGHVPQGSISYGYPFLLAPIAHFAGASVISGLPLVIALNLLVLWPIALFCVYGIAKVIGGRGFAYVAMFAWTAFPLAAIPYFYGSYHVRYIDQSLPSVLGLDATSDFPAMVAVLVAAYFALKAATERNPKAALMAGLAVGFAATVKPANLIFLPAPLAALAVARRPRELAFLCAGLGPALVGLALWKYRGLGYIPAFSHPPTATLASGVVTPLPVGSLRTGQYLKVNWGHIWHNMLAIREFTWSLRMVTWTVVAGIFGLLRRSATVGLLIGGWLACFVVLKGGAPGADVTDGSFFRYMEPSFPAYFFGLAAIAVLVPVWGRRLVAAGRSERLWPASRTAWRVVFGFAAVATVVPILAIAAFRPLTAASATGVPAADQYVPANSFALTAKTEGDGSVVLSWPAHHAYGARVAYEIFRTPVDGLVCTPQRHAATRCVFYSDGLRHLLDPLTQTTATSYRDHPDPGPWVYRVAATISSGGPIGIGDFMLLSRAASITESAY
jgi:hypothetical protein